jgi:hypothetical protein
MDVMAGTFGGLGVDGRFVEGWTTKELDSALPVECCAAYLSIHFVKYCYARRRECGRFFVIFL